MYLHTCNCSAQKYTISNTIMIDYAASIIVQLNWYNQQKHSQ